MRTFIKDGSDAYGTYGYYEETAICACCGREVNISNGEGEYLNESAKQFIPDINDETIFCSRDCVENFLKDEHNHLVSEDLTDLSFEEFFFECYENKLSLASLFSPMYNKTKSLL